MNKQRKARLEEIDRKIQIPWNSLEERKAINKEMEEIMATESQEPFDNEDLNKISLITISAFTRIYEFIGKVIGGEKQLKDSELKVFEKMLANLPQAAEDIETQAKYYQSIGLNSAANSQREMKKILEGDYKSFLIKAIQKEKSRRQNSPENNGGDNSNNDNGSGNNDDHSDNDNNNDNQNPPSDNSNDTSKKITNLQNQINALEEKLKNKPTSDNSSSEDQKKLARLKAEIEELKRKQKDKPSKENNNQDKKDNFPTGLVIGGTITIVLLLITVIFF